MWRTDTYWFDIAMATSMLLLGHMAFYRFESFKPRWKILIKSIVGVALVVGTTAMFGRQWTYVLIGAIWAMVVVVHFWWLPRHGINGWTAEPRDKYYELIGLDPDGRKRPKPK